MFKEHRNQLKRVLIGPTVFNSSIKINTVTDYDLLNKQASIALQINKWGERKSSFFSE